MATSRAATDVRGLHDRRHPVNHDDLMAPVELVSLTRREDQRNIGLGGCASALFLPAPRMPPTEL